MNIIKSLDDLERTRKEFLSKTGATGKKGFSPNEVRIRVHMGTSGLASGAKEIFEFFTRELGKRNIGGTVIKTGDMGYCFAEPTIEVTRPDAEPVVFGNVDLLRADEIIEKYIKNGEYVEGILPVNYQKIN